MGTPITAADRAEHALWVASELHKLHEHYGLADVWDPATAYRTGRVFDSEADLYRGPLATVLPYVTSEVRELIEQGRIQRWTVTQWAAAARERRAAEQAEAESAENLLSDLSYVVEQYDRRGELIDRARRSGASWADICTAVRLSRPQANRLHVAFVRAGNRPF
jgi:hypothetical protein